ncbi:MAG TPA: hypothetical protein GX016_08225 [Firmicutes bacterium]|nr:hypothetical protein [Bacillota bacterium]
MSNKEEVMLRIVSFLNSDARFLLLTGTHQNEKHVVALAISLSLYPAPATVLFRASSMSHVVSYLSPILNVKRAKSGTPIKIHGGYTLFLDSMNPRTWMSSPRSIDVAVVYPIDLLSFEDGDDCVHDLIRREVKKILLVSWTDNRDFSWTSQFNPIHVVYDVVEEDPTYHQKVIRDIARTKLERHTIKSLPKYAQLTPNDYLIHIWCDHCACGRWAKLNKPYPGPTLLRDAQMGEYTAKCLKCGYQVFDNYNWSRC